MLLHIHLVMVDRAWAPARPIDRPRMALDKAMARVNTKIVLNVRARFAPSAFSIVSS